MIEREADQSCGERESPRTMTPELLAARITLRVAELRHSHASTRSTPLRSLTLAIGFQDSTK